MGSKLFSFFITIALAFFSLPSFGDTILGWGKNSFGQASSPVDADFVTIAAGANHNLALKADGSIIGSVIRCFYVKTGSQVLCLSS